MFTGLIEATGRIERIVGDDSGRLLRVDTPLAAELLSGDSIAVNGVCLTVTTHDLNGFTADVSRQTLAVTALGEWAEGRTVNLERPVRADARMGGHFVLGHVDGIGRIVTFREDGAGFWLEVETPADFEPYLIARGSVAIDGISLTVASLGPRRFGVQVIPFTHAHTSLSEARVGDAVNLEADVLGKYVRRLLSLGHPLQVELAPMERIP